MQPLDQVLAQLVQEFHVQGGVDDPGFGQWMSRPVGGTVSLGETHPEQILGQGGQTHAGEAEDPRRQFGVEEGLGAQAHLGQARQVLRRRMEDPFGGVYGVGQGIETAQRRGVDQMRAGALPPQLDEVGALSVAVARGPFGVDSHGAGSACHSVRHGHEGVRGVHDIRDPLRRVAQDRGLVVHVSHVTPSVDGRGAGGRGCPGVSSRDPRACRWRPSGPDRRYPTSCRCGTDGSSR